MSGQMNLFETPRPDPRMPVEPPRFLDGLNERQRDAVLTSPDQPLQVLAGAGTGKTELISRRFVKLAADFREQGMARPEDRILVVTFTNDAALGMRERIHQRLMDAGEDGLGPDAWIGTFHQLAMRLLRAHPLEVNLPPDFAVLNSLEQQMLFNRVAQGVLSGDYAQIEAPLRRSGLNGLMPPDILSIASLESLPVDDVPELLEPMRLYRLINRIKTAGLSPAEFVTKALAQTRRLTERLKTLPVPHDPDLDGLDNVRAKMAAWRDALRDWAHPGWDPVHEVDARAEASGKKVTPGTYKDELKSLAALYLIPRSFAPKTPDFTLLDTALAQEECLIRLVGAVYALYQDALLTQAACDFDDLINHAIRLLRDHPGLRARYQAQFAAVIVDEFQDSNGSQLRLLELLVRDGASNLTVVGDEKQSIYAFRFAQPENLDLIFQNSNCKRVDLQINYRSRPPVLRVANALTAAITDKPNQTLQACEGNAGHEGPRVTWVNLDALDETADGRLAHRNIADQKALEAHFIAVEIARLVQTGEYRFSDMAVLVKSHAKAEAIQQALSRFGIPSVRQKNLGFFQEPVIKDAMALLRLMQNLADDLSLVRILQGKLNQRQLRDLVNLQRQLEADGRAANLFETCLTLGLHAEHLPCWPEGLSLAVADLATQLFEARKLKSRLTPVQLFLQLARRIGLIDSAAPAWQQKQQRISLRTFERLLYLFGQNRPLQPTLDEVIETLAQYAADPNQELPVADVAEAEDAVRLMTVFAAKGLEFPVVFAAYTERGQVRGSDDGGVVFDPQYAGRAGFGLILSRVDGQANPKRELYQKCWQAPRARTEAQRIFYVALTRAREKLYVLRCSQSFDWTDPAAFPADALAVISESADEETLFEQIWNVDADALREAMQAVLAAGSAS